jgi:hypothetical protein
MNLVPVDNDPFAQSAPQLIPVDHDPFAAPAAQPAQPAAQPYQYKVLPFSEDAQGNPHFDSNAGVLGAVKNLFTLPHDVSTGAVDPMSDEGGRRAFQMAGTILPDAAGLGTVPASVAAPTAEALRATGDAGYDAMRDMGVDYSSGAVSNVAFAIRNELEKDGIYREGAPRTHATLDRLQNPPPDSVAPLSGLDSARKSFGEAAGDFKNPTEQKGAGIAQSGLENFISEPGAENVISGPADLAARTLEDARGNWAASKRSDQLTGVADTADLRAAVANSGLNLDNTIRQRVASVLTSPKQSAGFSPDELAALNEVARGTPSRNALRFVGNFMGGGGGLGSMLWSGLGAAAGEAAAGGPGGAFLGGIAAPAVGVSARSLANTLTSKALSRADQLVRQRSPLYTDAVANAPMQMQQPSALFPVSTGTMLNPGSKPPTIGDAMSRLLAAKYSS